MSKYEPMTQFLLERDVDRLRLGFRDVEKILGFPLPKSAGTYQAWWANDESHSQAQGWLRAGWQTENLNLAGGVVEFVRVRSPSGNSLVRSKRRSSARDPWGALAGTVTIHDAAALTAPSGEVWESER